MAAVWKELMDAVQTGIQALALTYSGGTSLPSGQVYLRKIATDRNTTLPMIQVALGGKETIEGGDFEDHEVIYPVLVATVFASNQDLTLNGDALLWRQQIIDMAVAFETTLQGSMATAVITQAEVEPLDVVDMTLFKDQNLDVGGVLLKFRTNRTRTR